MKVLLFEQWNGGHYDNYLRCLVPEIARRCDRLVIAVNADTRQSKTALESWARLPNVEFARTLPAVGAALKPADRRAAVTNLVSSLRAVRPDFTMLPSADAQSSGLAAMKMLGWNVSKTYGPIEGTLHYGYGFSVASRKERLKEFVYSNTYRRLPFSSVNFVNGAYYEYAVERRLVSSERLRFVGDPVPQPERIGKLAARRLLGVPEDGRLLGLLGSLDTRKAVPQILAAFRAADLRPDDRLLLAGRLDASFARLIADGYQDLIASGRLIVLDRFLSAEELEHGYEALDLATVAYNRFPGLASLALKSVAAGTPILAHDFGWLRFITRRFGIGECTDVFDTPGFAAAMRDALERAGAHTQDEAVKRLLRFHTEENFVAHMTRSLQSPNGPQPLDWKWVNEAVPAERRHRFAG